MTFLRYSTRAVHKAIVDYITEQLETLGWTDADETPAGATPLRFISSMPNEADELSKLQAGAVAITYSDETAAQLEEMGGPLSSYQLPIFVDIFMANDTEALLVAEDVRDILRGRLPGTSRSLQVTDLISGDPVDGWRIEFEDVVRGKPEGKLNWQVVSTTAVIEFPEELRP